MLIKRLRIFRFFYVRKIQSNTAVHFSWFFFFHCLLLQLYLGKRRRRKNSFLLEAIERRKKTCCTIKCNLSRMARREDHHRHHQLHYVSVLPSNINGHNHNDSSVTRRLSEQERTKAVS